MTRTVAQETDGFNGKLPTKFDENIPQSRRSTFTKDEIVFNEIIPNNLDIEPEAKKSRRSTFTLESPHPTKNGEKTQR